MPRDTPDVRLVVFLVGLTQLVITTDFSIVAVALPSIGRQLALDPASLSWVLSAAALTGGGFLILAGRAADVFGQRLCLLVGLGVFALGSIGASLSPTLPVLIACRAFQGVGAAILAPANFSLINTLVPEGAPRRHAMGVFGLMQGVSLVIGLLIGGFLTTHFGWRAVFLLNSPIAVLAMAIAARIVPRKTLREEREGHGVDWAGAAAIVAATGLVLLGISTLGREGVASPRGLVLLGAGLVGFVVFFLVEGRAAAPLAPLSMFGRRNFTPATLILLMHLAGIGGVFVLLNIYMQTGLKMSAQQSGLGMMPYAAAVMAAGQVAAPIMARASHRAITFAAFAMYGCGLLALATLSEMPSYWIAVAVGSLITAFGATTAFMAMMAEATADIPHHQQGAASAVLFTAQQIGIPLGATLALSVLGLARGGGLAAFRDGYLILAAVVFAALTIGLFTLRRAPPAPGAALSPSFLEPI
jgi:MFS family permease